MDATKIRFRKTSETFWVLQLRTVFPYDFNDCTGGKKFPSLARNHASAINGHQILSVLTSNHFLNFFL